MLWRWPGLFIQALTIDRGEPSWLSPQGRNQTPGMKDQIEDVKVFRLNVARLASDHFPVYVKLKCDPPAAKP